MHRVVNDIWRNFYLGELISNFSPDYMRLTEREREIKITESDARRQMLLLRSKYSFYAFFLLLFLVIFSFFAGNSIRQVWPGSAFPSEAVERPLARQSSEQKLRKNWASTGSSCVFFRTRSKIAKLPLLNRHHRFRDQVQQRWLAKDPCNIVATVQENFAGLVFGYTYTLFWTWYKGFLSIFCLFKKSGKTAFCDSWLKFLPVAKKRRLHFHLSTWKWLSSHEKFSNTIYLKTKTCFFSFYLFLFGRETVTEAPLARTLFMFLASEKILFPYKARKSKYLWKVKLLI